MPVGKTTPKEIREQILNRIKNDHVPVSQVAREFGLSDNTVYGWIHGKASGSPGLLEVNALRRKIDGLYQLIGELTAQLSDQKKKNGNRQSYGTA
jgi:transposase-like protein